MENPIATVQLSRTWPFLLQTLGLVLVIGLFDSFIVARFLNGTARPGWILGALLVTVGSARFIFGQALVVIRGLSPNRAALWVEGERLIYLSPFYSSLPLKDLGAIDLQVLRRGLGQQPYGVITNGSGKKMHLHLSILNEPLDQLKDRFKGLIRA